MTKSAVMKTRVSGLNIRRDAHGEVVALFNDGKPPYNREGRWWRRRAGRGGRRPG